MVKSLKARQSPLSDTSRQLEILEAGPFSNGELPQFAEKLETSGFGKLKPAGIKIFQVNIGYMCNMTCVHCHVDAGPDRKEMMTRENLEKCIEIVRKHDIPTIDLTGGAPEMHPDFFWFVEELSKLNREVIVRSNLTIILANKKYYRLPEFFRKHKVRVACSLPFYSKRRTDRQRGEGTFDKSVKALQMLNDTGYGKKGSGLVLDLVYNPGGAYLPDDQAALEVDFKKELWRKHQVEFNNLMTITNLPISRFLEYLLASGNYEDYMYKLVEAYNPAALKGVMCRDTLSIDWQGYIYDCDFNQMLNIKVNGRQAPQHIDDFDLAQLENREIVTGQHCYGCTAGAGSGCQGATT